MERIFKSQSLSIGLAMFSMFFGAGNIIFPLAIGQSAGDQNFFAILGMILTAAIMPIAGVIAMVLFDGNYREFFGRLGKIPGFLLSLMIISLLGPLGSTPRCIALSYTTLTALFPLSPLLFSALACALIFLCTFRKRHLITLLGWVLTPLLLLSLITIILLGLFTPHTTPTTDHSHLATFFHGLKEGYNTMDLLAAFFFSATIIQALRRTHTLYLHTALRASTVGALLLTTIYIGFSYLAAFHGSDLNTYSKDALLSAITLKIAGPYAGLLVCLTISLACLTTAIALISAFTDFIHKELFHEKLSYTATLAGALLFTFCISTFSFTGISAFLTPILQICYPALILLTFLNIAHKLTGLKSLKLPVFLTFLCSLPWNHLIRHLS